MGCTQSKIENEETVTRCKERKQFMKEAVSARNAFAAAHSAYSMALKNTGAALSDYARGEVQHPSSSTISSGAPALPQPPVDTFPPPPPPLPPHLSSPLQRAATMPEMSFPEPDMKHPDAILEEENEDELESESGHGLKHRGSTSSGGGLGSRSGISHRDVVQEDELPKPPSPPPQRTPPHNNREPPPSPPPSESKGMAASSWDYFFPSMENVPGPTLAEVDEGRVEREEFERKVLEERTQRNEIDSEGGGGTGGDGASSSGGGRSGGKEELAEVVEKPPEVPPQPPQAPARVKRVKQVVPAEGKRKGNTGVNLLQTFSQLDDCFLKASESAHDVSKMLEAARLHYHSNFADNRGN